MKQLKLAVIALFALVTVVNVSAQDENNPWVIGFGINAIDMYNGNDFASQIRDGLGSKDWNILPSISRISAEKYIDKGFTVQLAGTVNKIKHHIALNDSDYIIWSIGAVAKYDLNNLFGDTGMFDPYIFAGGDYVASGKSDQSELMGHGGVGFNLWLNDNFGLNFQHGSKLGFGEKVRSHYQNSLGLVFKFGGKDSDGDGVYDKDDACPEVAGLKEFNGCPDADGDGVKDSDDACPNVAGLAAMNGCPDADGDGVADKDDMCPNSKGTKANNGCPDTDGDGVVDKDDKCATVAGPSANGGCPWPDTDGDGVLDKDDNCKNEVGPASNNGCPEPVIKDDAIKAINMSAKTILFNSGRSSFKPGVTARLDAIVAIMKTNARATFAIEGHTDSAGRAASNLKLSNSRANAVMKYFVSNGVDASRLSARGYGEDNPIDSNKTRAGRANNRRVEIKVTN
ncbi:outer membrane protein OmpA-like peptidoglycan-associated protein [Lutibacter sp. Hel_I_33_5]|uniref:OmpA family protein n=1 Tax=Lutibacter sp. Hel_I_33_5 TaxID=1566289 RepID=UPI0011A5423E|nr:OmpA family protein [Lutibacter sp. Hel_I_33_5]TVZ56150.1 outer membrane protein OmpA-like peptidoglycan-associated protein [Lutibacter sp. Hel_I_33_5]